LFFFSIFKYISVTRLSLLTLPTPVVALLPGKYLNDEPLGLQITAGTIMILMGLASCEFGYVVGWTKNDPG